MGAAGGIQYIVLKPGTNYSRFRSLMSVIPVDHNGGPYDYSSFKAPKEEYYMGYYTDTYRCFDFKWDLELGVLSTILNKDFHWSLGVTQDSTWSEVVEDFQTSPNAECWPDEWDLIVDHIRFGIPEEISTMTLRDWAKEMKSMIQFISSQETWT